jgi:DNA polymerase-3 subunit beta
MKLKINRDDLLTGIQIVQGVISPRSALPILSNILLDANQDKLKLTSTDLDIGINCAISVGILENGSITVPAKRFSDIIKELPSEEVSITTKKNNQVIIETNTCQFKIMGLAAEEFPKLPEFKDKEIITIDQMIIKEMVTMTSFAVSLDETRHILNGILFKIKDNHLTLVATDGRRLALIEKKLTNPINKSISIIVPIKTIHELSRNLQREGQLSLVLSGNQALFELGDVIIVSRLIEGEFPDYKQVIPPASTDKVKIDRQLFLLAVRRAALLTTPDYQAVKLELFKNKLVVSKATPDIGESREELAAEYSGRELVIGFNPNYLIDALKILEDDKVEMEITDSERPGVVRCDDYIYIVLPMRLG